MLRQARGIGQRRRARLTATLGKPWAEHVHQPLCCCPDHRIPHVQTRVPACITLCCNITTSDGTVFPFGVGGKALCPFCCRRHACFGCHQRNRFCRTALCNDGKDSPVPVIADFRVGVPPRNAACAVICVACSAIPGTWPFGSHINAAARLYMRAARIYRCLSCFRRDKSTVWLHSENRGFFCEGREARHWPNAFNDGSATESLGREAPYASIATVLPVVFL